MIKFNINQFLKKYTELKERALFTFILDFMFFFVPKATKLIAVI